VSPSESQLRAALHDGEGDGIDPGRVIARAEAIRRRRRVRIASVAGTVAAVAAIAVTVPLLNQVKGSVATSGTPVTSQQDHAAVGQAPGVGSSAAPSAGANTKAPPRAGEVPACPASASPVVVPSHPASTSGGGQLFPTPVTALRVCEIGNPAGNYVLVGDKAQAVVDDLNALTTGAAATPCPADYGPIVVLIAIDVNGNQRTAVGNAGGCGAIVSGSAYRTTARAILRELLSTAPSPARLPSAKTAPRASPGPGPS
jgi:hypothetical protein